MKDFGYVCDLCGRRGSDVMPTSDDDSGFSLYDQPALCRDCAKTWGESTREYRAQWRRDHGIEDGEEVPS